jgi:hypothetical protein
VVSPDTQSDGVTKVLEVRLEGMSSPTIRQSKLSGNQNSLLQTGPSTAKVALTQLVGPVKTEQGGAVPCFNNYDDNLGAVNCLY